MDQRSSHGFWLIRAVAWLMKSTSSPWQTEVTTRGCLKTLGSLPPMELLPLGVEHRNTRTCQPLNGDHQKPIYSKMFHFALKNFYPSVTCYGKISMWFILAILVFGTCRGNPICLLLTHGCVWTGALSLAYHQNTKWNDL